MIKNQKQTSGDQSVNYMAGGDIVINGLTKEELLSLLEEHSKTESIPQEELLSTREDVKEVIAPLFEENSHIFHTYGPMTEERFNPESEMPEQWIRKIQDFILPNNRKILEAIEKNKNLLLDFEKDIFTKFKQHVDDFEAKHTGKTKANGTTFPADILLILE